MEAGLAPCPRAVAQLAACDSLPPDYRAFLREYRRGVKAADAAKVLRICDNDVEEAMHEIRVALPTGRR